MANTSYPGDGLIATTLKHYIPTLEDNVFSSKPLLWSLRNAGRIKSFTGTHIVQPLIYAEAPNVGSYEDDDVFATAANTGISAAEYPWKQYYGLVHFTGIELAKNSGREAVLNLMEARMQQVEMTIAENLNEMLFADGSGNGNKDWYGLAAVVDSSNPSWGNFGGIDRSTNAYWRSTETAVNNALTVARMVTAYNDASEGIDQPTNVFTDQERFEDYEALIQADQRFMDPAMGDAGFQNLMFKGAPVVFDTYCQSGVMYFLNLKYITLAKLNDVWFQPSEMLAPTNQDVWYKHLKLYGNLIASNCQRHSKLTGLT